MAANPLPAMSTYERSQRLTTVPLAAQPNWPALSRAVLEGPDAPARQARGQFLVNELNRALELPRCALIVADRRQVHRTARGRLTSKTYGYYRCEVGGATIRAASIRIYNRTAIREQILSPRVFLGTLLHEWTHHYDFAGLRLARSPHTRGFFERVRSVAQTLGVEFVVPPKREPATIDHAAVPASPESQSHSPPPPPVVAAIRAILARSSARG